MAEDFSKLSPRELIEEIAREETHLAELRRILGEAEQRRNETLRIIREEQLLTIEDRYRARADRIEKLTRALSEYDRQITRVRSVSESYNRRISETETRLKAIQDSLAFQERRARTAISPIDRYIATRVAEDLRREVTRLRRSISALSGWETRTLAILFQLIDLKTWTEARINSLKGWQKREETRLKRLLELRNALANLETQISTIRATIVEEEERLKKKKELVPPLEIVHSKIVIYAITESEEPRRPYKKRFQGFFNVDAIRNTSTGDVDYSHELTKDELDSCTWEFYLRWNWVKEGEPIIPKNTSTPEWAETGEWEPIEEPEGATIKEISVIEEEEETYFQKFEPPIVIYTPTPAQIRAMLKYIGKTDEEIDKILGV